MLKIGCHLSIAKGYTHAGKQALSIDANTFQYFTRNPRGGKAKKLDEKDLADFTELVEKEKMGMLFAHAPYTLNFCSDKERVREFALQVFAEDLERLAKLPASYYIFHPGSHVGQGVKKGIEWIARGLNRVIDPSKEVEILLEGMSGKGSEIGGNFEELKQIIDKIEHSEGVGICLDTCHLYSAGYDIVNDLEGVLETIDQTVGLERVKAIHLNDSKTELGSQKDRHEVLGEGTIGYEASFRLINHPKLRDLPFNLETPNEIEGYQKEIRILREHYGKETKK